MSSPLNQTTHDLKSLNKHGRTWRKMSWIELIFYGAVMNCALEALCAAHKPSAPCPVDAPRQRKNTLCENAQCVARLPNAPRRLVNTVFVFKMKKSPSHSLSRLSIDLWMQMNVSKQMKISYRGGFNFCFSQTHFVMFGIDTFSHFNTTLFFQISFWFFGLKWCFPGWFLQGWWH